METGMPRLLKYASEASMPAFAALWILGSAISQTLRAKRAKSFSFSGWTLQTYLAQLHQSAERASAWMMSNFSLSAKLTGWTERPFAPPSPVSPL